MKKLKKITKKGLEKKLDELVKEIVFKRDRYGCVTCPIWRGIKFDKHIMSDIMQPGHYITRGAKTVRWDLRNVYKQCKTCNFLHEIHPEVLAKYVVATLGQKGFDELVRDGNRVQPSIHVWELQQIYDKLLQVKEKKEKWLNQI